MVRFLLVKTLAASSEVQLHKAKLHRQALYQAGSTCKTPVLWPKHCETRIFGAIMQPFGDLVRDWCPCFGIPALRVHGFTKRVNLFGHKG